MGIKAFGICKKCFIEQFLVYPAAGFKHARYLDFYQVAKFREGKMDKFNKCDIHGKAFSLVVLEY